MSLVHCSAKRLKVWIMNDSLACSCCCWIIFQETLLWSIAKPSAYLLLPSLSLFIVWDLSSYSKRADFSSLFIMVKLDIDINDFSCFLLEKLTIQNDCSPLSDFAVGLLGVECIVCHGFRFQPLLAFNYCGARGTSLNTAHWRMAGVLVWTDVLD